MFRVLLHRFGFHRWIYYGKPGEKNRMCVMCGKNERFVDERDVNGMTSIKYWETIKK